MGLCFYIMPESFGSTLPKVYEIVNFLQHTTKSLLTKVNASSKLILDGGRNNDTKTAISRTAYSLER